MSEPENEYVVGEQFLYSTKYEPTAQGIRIHVRVYTNDKELAKTLPGEIYNACLKDCASRDPPIQVAPFRTGVIVEKGESESKGK